MKLLDRLRLKSAQILVRNLTIRGPDGWYTSEQMSDAGEIMSSSNSALVLSAVWACVNLIAGTGATLPLMVYKTAGRARTVAKDHHLYSVLHDSPNFDQTAVDFWEFVFASLELWGNAYARKVRLGGKVVGLLPIAPEGMRVRRLPSGKIEYRWSADGKSYVETDENILHVRGFGGDPLGGWSTLHYARHTFGLARAIDRSASAFFRNGMRPAGVLSAKEWLKGPQREVLEEHLIGKFTGAMNTGRPMVLEGGMTWNQLTIKPEDAQMLQSRGFSVEEICRYFAVPPFMIGHTEKTTSWGTGLTEQTLGFQKFTLRRRLKRIEQALMKQLLTPEDRANGIVIEFNIDGLLRGDALARAKFYEIMTRNGIMTRNQAREFENWEPMDGADELTVQSQNIPITGAADENETRETVRRLIAEERGQEA